MDAMTGQEILLEMRCITGYKGALNIEGAFRMSKEAIGIIKRQQEEIERLKCMVGQNEGVLPQYEALIKSEAIREFADRLKDVFVTIDGTFECWEVEDHIDNLAKEMTEDKT